MVIGGGADAYVLVHKMEKELKQMGKLHYSAYNYLSDSKNLINQWADFN